MPFVVFAQPKVVKHTVAAHESYSSIGRLYNVNGRVIANFNKLDYEVGLAIGQVLNIPTTGPAPKVETPKVIEPKEEIPVEPKPKTVKGKNAVVHTVGKKETLYGLSKMYDVTIADIKKWNSLTEDGLKEGSELIVGYGDKVQPKVVETPKAVDEAPKVIKKPVVKEEPKIVKTVPKKVVVEEPIDKEPKPIQDGYESRDFKGGIFRTLYKGSNNSVDGIAGIFKSTSGWEDGKYYCLHNTAKQGSIIKVTNKANGKIIYAKVLDVMPDLKQNNAILIRISNAAADALGETIATNLSVEIAY
jgi:LysM repeat protein